MKRSTTASDEKQHPSPLAQRSALTTSESWRFQAKAEAPRLSPCARGRCSVDSSELSRPRHVGALDDATIGLGSGSWLGRLGRPGFSHLKPSSTNSVSSVAPPASAVTTSARPSASARSARAERHQPSKVAITRPYIVLQEDCRSEAGGE
jgi:hypothetical protein